MTDEKHPTRQRGEWTIKSPAITPELRSAVAIAARRSGKTIGDWVAGALWAYAQAELKRGATSAPATLDAVQSQLEQIAGTSRTQLDQIDQLARAVSALTDVVARLEERGEQRGSSSPLTWASDSLLWWTRFVPGFGRPA